MRTATATRTEPIRCERIDADTTEPHFSGDAMTVTYHQKTYTGYAWQCPDPDCRLVWDKKHLAADCASRNHRASFQQYYGGYVENGVHKGGTSYTRAAIRRN